MAQRQEQRAAQDYGGRVVPASGSGTRKGDVETDTELIECKHTERKSYSLKLADLAAHAFNAIVTGKRPVFEIEFTDPAGRDVHPFVVLLQQDYLDMRNELAELRDYHCPGCEGLDS